VLCLYGALGEPSEQRAAPPVPATTAAAAAVKQVTTGKQVVIKEWMAMTSPLCRRLRRRMDGPTHRRRRAALDQCSH